MSTATLDAPQVQNGSAPARRNRRASTPRSMVPKQADAAISTPREIDYHAVVASVMLIKGKDGGYGERVTTRKGAQHVFALACNAVKSMIGLANKEDGKPVRLPEGSEIDPIKGVVVNGVLIKIDHPARIRAAIETVLDRQWARFKAYGGSLDSSDIKWTWDRPKHKIVAAKDSSEVDAAGNKLVDLDLRWKATAVATRDNKDVGEAILCAYRVKEAAEKRLENMDKKPGEYSREQKREVMDLIHLAIWKIGRLEAQKAHEQRQAVAIQLLEAQAREGKLTNAEFEAQRTAILAEKLAPQAAVEPAK